MLKEMKCDTKDTRVFFNDDLDFEIYKLNQNPYINFRNRNISDSEYIGRRFINNGKIVIVQSVHRHYYQGYYKVMVFKDFLNSHGMKWFKNINHFGEIKFNEIEWLED